MKKALLSFAAVAALLAMAACAEKKETQGETGEPAVVEVTDTTTTPAAPADTVAAPAEAAAPAENAVITVKGEVTAINRGKDGYSATIKTAEGKFYIATISIPNMANPKQYRAVKQGEVITVTGESFPVEEDVMIKVTELK